MLNKTELKSKTLKKIAVLSVITSMFLVGCSNDQRYKREVDSNEDYLNAPALKSLIIPEGVSVPQEVGEYYVINNNVEGAVGKQLDIRPPVLTISTIPDAFVLYKNGTVTFNVPVSYGIWNNIPNTLNKQNILVSSSDSTTIKINDAIITRKDEQQPVNASFVVTRQMHGNAETITIVLSALTRGGENLMSQPIEVQRYVVGLFNHIMNDVAPESLWTVPVKDSTDENKKND
ncbi:outer membrane protein assembly factor BamC [Gilliamella apicola]|uniref:Outer membrane protein assembly factor BamC n=1 Tax=Gilliamella apicola TaxID=1196095 RepID=A0A2V4E5B7_9GAMM|nr:outer membrane protein assembly factor BamC [Gilliamella apicola]PXZ06086.1 hypothetical protein DKK79_05335 [Gilliamella apicola]